MARGRPFVAGQPRPARSGRRAGTPNRVSQSVREALAGALRAKGGQEYFERQADDNPGAFMALVGKLLPIEHSIDPDSASTVAELLRQARP